MRYLDRDQGQTIADPTKMLVLLAVFAFLSLVMGSGMAQELAVLTAPLQEACVHQSPPSTSQEIYAGLVCGARIGRSQFKQNLIRTSLIHLIVASGTNLAIIELAFTSLWRRRSRTTAKTWVLFPLILYAFIAGLCPPFVRVLAGWILQRVNVRFRLNWSPLQILIISGFATLAVCGTRFGLLSLALSWIAGLAVYLADAPMTAHLEKNANVKNPLLFQVLIYLLMLPALLPLAIPHPLSIVWNILLGPPIAFLVFPAAFIGYATDLGFRSLTFFGEIFNPILYLSDRIIDACELIVAYAARLTPKGGERTDVAPFFTWLYLFTLLIVALGLQYRSKRDRC